MAQHHPYPARPPARTERKAAVSLVLGLVSMGLVGPIAGVPAIILGSLARRDIDQSGGTLTGHAIAAGGILSGLFGTGLGLVLVLSIVGAAFTPDAPDGDATLAATPAAVVRPTDESAPSPALTQKPRAAKPARPTESLEAMHHRAWR